jgi:hypothetical protein
MMMMIGRMMGRRGQVRKSSVQRLMTDSRLAHLITPMDKLTIDSLDLFSIHSMVSFSNFKTNQTATMTAPLPNQQLVP